jgi:DNA repair protein RadD
MLSHSCKTIPQIRIMTLRPYQQEAHNAIFKWVRKSRAPCMIEAATGSGKSHIIAAVAETIHRVSEGKRVLCLAPSAELVVQNYDKYLLTGSPASIFSASAGRKELRHPVVFGTPLTVKNRIHRFGKEFAMVVIDECHGITPTVKDIIEAMKAENENLRVVGMSATPYRMGSGYVFGQWPDGKPVPAHQTINPYFDACLHRVTAPQLIEQGYLTPPVFGAIRADSYRTLDMALNSRGQFDAEDVDRAYHGHGRKTAAIIADVVAQAQERQGVIVFAATVRHAEECLASLPPGLSAIVTAETSKNERAGILARFKSREIKYLVNVAVLTTGFDAPHVDVIAMLRATESPGLFQQIVGRGLRLCDGKKDCLILDYAENAERHCPDGDIFAPTILAVQSEIMDLITVECPLCKKENEFRCRPNPDGYEIDRHGYFVDLDGNPVQTEWGAMPGHFGRRCQAKVLTAGDMIQCTNRWTGKECPHCEEDNDIAARYCESCKGELVDPNEKLKIEFQELKKDPRRKQTDKVLSWTVKPTISKAGRDVDRIDVVTPYRSFSFWVMKNPTWPRAIRDRRMFDALGGVPPVTITYAKDAESGFFRVFAFDRKADEVPA